MPLVSYHSTTFDRASAQEAVGTTSSQIFLSRGVADPDGEPATPSQNDSVPSIASTFESSSKHIMTLGEAPRASVVEKSNGTPSAADEIMQPVCCDFVQLARRSRYFPSTDGESASPPNDCGHPPTKRARITSCHLTNEPESTSELIHNDKHNEVERGRTMERGPRYPNPLARAESRRRREDAAIELDAQPILKRPSRSSTFFDDQSDPCAVLEDELLEPCPHLSMCSSFSEVLNSSGDALMAEFLNPRSRAKTASIVHTGDASLEKSSRALTTVFAECRPQSPSPTFPQEVRSRIQPDIGHLEDVASKSSVQENCSQAEKGASPKPLLSLAAGLPTEVIQQIFYGLHPLDFNSARHTCRSWFINSLKRSLLETMLRRGGWSPSIPRNIRLNLPLNEQDTVNEVWQMSKRISRECALGPDWTGNGLGDNMSKSATTLNKSAFMHTSTTDFTDVAVHYPGLNSSGTLFTVSCCGKFLMAANGCLIYIYELNKTSSPLNDGTSSSPGSLRPVTSILCPRRVLACSMDTSSHRYAIAVLLDGRMGLVCDLDPANIKASFHTGSLTAQSGSSKPESSKASSNAGDIHSNRSRGPSFLDRVSLNSSSSTRGSNRASSEPHFVFPGIAATPALGSNLLSHEVSWQDRYKTDSPEIVRTEGPSSRNPSLPRARTLDPGTPIQSNSPPHVERESDIKSVPVESGPRSLYRDLCSDDDPPRSVAICPQRRCVAFGCSAGIELQWVDALTGQDLNRWFPLTAPSDYLFFLPPRRSVDSAKKLRLISSAARPGERAAISERAFGGRSKNSPFWEHLGWGAGIMDDEEVADQTQGMVSRLRNEVRTRGLNGRVDYSDHYRAIPLSDGYHILFTDPSTGLLCLGSDAPVGGPTKLLRKIWFQGPEGADTPVAYAGGYDLSLGVRVVAAFGSGSEQRVWLFSVPSDVFATNNPSSDTMTQGLWIKSGSRSQIGNLEWMNWWSDNGLHEWLSHSQEPVPGILPRSIWPVKIKGQEIGKFRGLVDLTIDSGPSMTIWAFSSEGIAKVWHIDDGKFDGSVKERMIARDGTIREVDREGDLEMADAPSASSYSSLEILVPPLPLDQDSPPVETSAAPPLPSEDLVPPLSRHAESFDGTASFTISGSTTFTTRSERPRRIQYTQRTVQYDADGDILMDDLHDSETEEAASQDSLDEVTLARAGKLVYETFHSGDRAYVGLGADFVEELTGIARIDIEIR